MTIELQAAIAAIDKRFQSGNAVPVERATVLASEWAELRAALAAPVAPTMTREEWTRRYADRIMAVAGWSDSEAMSAALVGAEDHERNEREAGDTVDWMDPEDDADVEMSYWDDDEATQS